MEARWGAGGRMNSTQGAGMQLFTRLRRHASLEGVNPYFHIKKWKLDTIHRASSLDMRGSPKRRQFQRQRAASESKDDDQDECDSSRFDYIQYIARTHAETYRPSSPSVSIPALPSSPPPSLGRLELEVEPIMEASSNGAAGLTTMAPELQEEEPEAGAGLGGGPVSRQESCEHQTLYRDIWLLRASLEQYASSDQSSNNDRDSVRSEAGSMSSLVGGASRGPLTSCPSQDIGDELEGELSGEPVGRRQGGKQDSVDSERGSDGESGNRKLLQMDSGYASIEAPSRVPEELRLFVTAGGGGGGGAKAKTASEKRHFFTSSGRKGSVCESFELRLSEEEMEEEEVPGSSVAESPVGWQPFGPREPRRDFSIDEKTDALFHEFLRRDPQFDQQESPARQKHRSSRVHLRKQWQRTKQRSDPGVRLPPGLERQRPTLRRGDSANYPLDTRYHSTLSRIVSAADEEAGDEDKAKGSPSHSPPPDGRPPSSGYGPQTVTVELADKLVSSLEDKLYAGLRAAKGSCECVATAVHASPDHSPV